MKLVTLSARETGHLDLPSGEATRRLPTALHVARAKSRVISLCQVNDAVTPRIMVKFSCPVFVKKLGALALLCGAHCRECGARRRIPGD